MAQQQPFKMVWMAALGFGEAMRRVRVSLMAVFAYNYKFAWK